MPHFLVGKWQDGHMLFEPMLLRGRVVLSDSIIDDAVIVVKNGVIADIIDAQQEPMDRAAEEFILAAQPTQSTFIPGLVDVHCHGGGGESFPNAVNPDLAMTAVMEHRQHGTTTLVASLVTADRDVLKERAAMLVSLAKQGEIAGIHFEGPFVSHARCGAQDPTFIIDPDPAFTGELMELCDGYAVSMTVAPEKARAYGEGSVAEILIHHGALPSWGHTDSGATHARAAVAYSRQCIDKAGDRARSPHATVTHFFNGMRPLHHRDTGPIAEFLSDAVRGGAILELICDGVHLDPSIVRDVYEIVGRDHCVLITDAMAAAGMADGAYTLGSQDVVVKDGVARLAHGESIAGGTAHLLDCLRVAVTEAGIPLIDAVYMASAQGAKILGDDSVGVLRPGCVADIVEIDEEFRALHVWRNGKLVK